MNLLSRLKREFAVLGAYATLMLTLLFARPDFFRRQFLDTWISATPVLIVAIGMTLVMISRQIDISVGSQFSVCAVFAALLAKQGMPMPLVVAAVAVCGGLFGAINGLFVAIFRLPAIVVTLATMVILRESLSLAREGAAVGNLPSGFQWFGLSQGRGELLLLGVAASFFVVAAWATVYLTAGRAAYAVGSDPEAARLAGIRPAAVTFAVFMLTGVLAGIAGSLEAVRQAQVATNLGADLELKVIAAVVIGGTAVSGGKGTLLGTLIGVALLSSVRPALGFLGNFAEWEQAAQGLIILLAVGSESLFRTTEMSAAAAPSGAV